MRYRIFLYKAKHGVEDWINYAVINQFNEKKFVNARYASNDLLPFDVQPIAGQLQDTLGNRAKVVIKYPPESMNQVAYILVVTSYENSESIINPVLTVACENHLAFFDAETKKTFCSDNFIGNSKIQAKLRANQICRFVRENWDVNAVYRFRHICSLNLRKREEYYVITLKKPKDGNINQIIRRFDEIFQSCVQPGEVLVHHDKSFAISGKYYSVTIYLEGYYKHADRCWSIDRDKVVESLIHRMPYERMLKWLNSVKELEKLDTLYRLGHNEMVYEYDDLLERLAASIKLTKELQRLPCKVSIGPVVHPSPQGLSFHLYDEDGYENADDLSMFRIEDTYDDCRFMQFTYNVLPYTTDRCYDETIYPIQLLEAVGNQLKEVKNLIRQDPYSNKLSKFYEKMPFTTFSPDEIDKDKERFITLFDILTKWIDWQLEHCDSDSAMFVVIGP